MEKSIENMLMTCVRYAANVLNIKYLHKDTISELINHFKYYFAIEYLKRNDWNKRIKMIDLALALFSDGKYYKQYHDIRVNRANSQKTTQNRKHTFHSVVESNDDDLSENMYFNSMYRPFDKMQRSDKF